MSIYNQDEINRIRIRMEKLRCSDDNSETNDYYVYDISYLLRLVEELKN